MSNVKLANVEIAEERIFAFRFDNDSYRIGRGADNQILVEKNGKAFSAGQVSPLILKYVRPTISPAAQEVIDKADSFDRRKIYEAISKIANTQETTTYGSNYGINCVRIGTGQSEKIEVTSVFETKRAHIAVCDSGEDGSIEMLRVFLDPKEADAYLQTFKVRRAKRFEFRHLVGQFDEEYETNHPRPELPDMPLKPMIRDGQSNHNYIETTLKAWRDKINKMAQSNNKKTDDWSAKLSAARSQWIKKQLGDDMKKYRLTEGDLVLSYSILLHDTTYYVANVPYLG